MAYMPTSNLGGNLVVGSDRDRRCSGGEIARIALDGTPENEEHVVVDGVGTAFESGGAAGDCFSGNGADVVEAEAFFEDGLGERKVV